LSAAHLSSWGGNDQNSPKETTNAFSVYYTGAVSKRRESIMIEEEKDIPIESISADLEKIERLERSTTLSTYSTFHVIAMIFYGFHVDSSKCGRKIIATNQYNTSSHQQSVAIRPLHLPIVPDSTTNR
jgi:hypothetical protein